MPGQSREIPGSIATEFRNLDKKVPRFAGIFFDEEGELTISIAADSLSEAGRGEIMRWAKAYSGNVKDGMRARIRRVKHSYFELDSLADLVRPLLYPSTGITEFAVDESRGLLVVSLLDPEGQGPALRASIARAGVPASAVAIRKGERGRPLTRPNGLRDAILPYSPITSVAVGTVSGYQISASTDPDFGSCTLGFIGYKRGSDGYIDASLGYYALTAAHCTGNNYGTLAASFGQPYIGGGHNFGLVEQSAPIYTAGCPYALPARCMDADVMVVKINSGMPDVRPGIAAKSTDVSGTVLYKENPPVNGAWANAYNTPIGALIGETVMKVGRTTGQTTGTVSQTCADTYDSEAFIWVRCSGKASLNGKGGDSGASVFIKMADGRAYAVGTAYYGTPSRDTYYSHAATVDAALYRRYAFHVFY